MVISLLQGFSQSVVLGDSRDLPNLSAPAFVGEDWRLSPREDRLRADDPEETKLDTGSGRIGRCEARQAVASATTGADKNRRGRAGRGREVERPPSVLTPAKQRSLTEVPRPCRAGAN